MTNLRNVVCKSSYLMSGVRKSGPNTDVTIDSSPKNWPGKIKNKFSILTNYLSQNKNLFQNRRHKLS